MNEQEKITDIIRKIRAEADSMKTSALPQACPRSRSVVDESLSPRMTIVGGEVMHS